MPIAFAGTEVYTHTLATMQKCAGHDVAVVIPHIEYYRPGQICEHYVYEGLDVYQYMESGDPTDRQIHYGIKKPAGLENFRQLMVKMNPDIIHFHELNRSIGLTTEHVKIAKQQGAKVLLTIHLSFYTCNTNVLVRDGKICKGIIRERTCSICTLKTLHKIPSIVAEPLTVLSTFSGVARFSSILKPGKATTLLRTPAAIKRVKSELKVLSEYLDKFVLYGKWYERILLENGIPGNKITIVPAALVATKKAKVLKITKPPQLPIRLVFIGRIQPQKGIHLIIEALRDFSADEIQIDFYGKQEETDYYTQCIKDTKDIKCITWMGLIERDAVLNTLTRYDILCLASTFSEMSPLVIQEAFAAGIPVIASKVYGNMEQVQDRHNGILFEFNSSKSLKEKMGELIENPGLIQQMKDNVVSPPGFELVNECYLQLYSSLFKQQMDPE